MATINNVKERLAAALGISVSVIERELRALREAGWTPAGRPGGGVGAAHYSKSHLSRVLMGFAGARHSDAPDAVEKLRCLPFRRVLNPPTTKEALPTFEDEPIEPALEDQLGNWLRGLAARYKERMQWTPELVAKVKTFEMQLCVEQPHAIIKYGPEQKTVYLYAADPKPTPVLRRYTVLTGDVLLAAAEMLADTEIHQDTLNAVKFLDATKRANAGQGQNDAEHHLRHEAGSASLDGRPLAKGSDAHNASEANGEREALQGCEASSRDGHHSTNKLDFVPT